MGLIKRLKVILLFAIFLAGCEYLVFEPEYEQLVLEEKVPQATIIDGPSEGETISSNSVYFEWSGNNNIDATFEFQLLGDSDEWINNEGKTSVTFEHLDEGEYTFRVKEILFNGIAQDTAASRTFTVNAIEGPALVLKKQKMLVSRGSDFSLQLLAEEVTSLLGVKAVITFDHSVINIVSVNSSDDFNSLAGSILDANQTGNIDISSVLLDNVGDGATGTVPVGELTFQVLSNATSNDEYHINLKTTSEMRDDKNNPIALSSSDLYHSIIEIK